MFEEINDYCQWNKALWAYFFPQKTENPILYLDAHLIEIIGKSSKIKANDYKEDFLSKVLLDKQKVSKVLKEWKCWSGYQIRIDQDAQYRKDLKKWTFKDLCFFLTDRAIDKTPAYFGMLCAIMYLACTVGANHGIIKREAKNYLGSDYKDDVGELIDYLFWCLHEDVNSFDPDRMICGNQRNMSRIKFHTILKASDRDDFIDFLEINNLKWEYELYSDFINDRVIPMLNRANKRQFINLVTENEYVPYVKSILQSGLNFGKTVSVSNNTKQTIDIIWKYELFIDSNGEPSFYISANSSLPFGLSIQNKNFIIDDSNRFSDYIATDTAFLKHDSCEIKWNSDTYCIKNVGSSDWKEILFKKVANGVYYQVPNLEDGNDYILFIQRGASNNNNLSKGRAQSCKDFDNDILEKYYVFEISDYKCDKSKTTKKSNKVDDTFCLYGVGTWFSIILQDSQKLYWLPDIMDSQYVPVNYIVGEDNKYYFRLPRTSESQISGKLVVTSEDPENENFDTNELIVDNFEWNGDNAKYYINGWGEISDQDCLRVGNTPPIRRQFLQVTNGQVRTEYNSTPTPLSDMLIQILFDVADENGCVSQTKLVAAIDFVFGVFGLIPTKQNRRSIIYALRRLGYMSSFYSPSAIAYVNQLTPSYLELSNYSFNGRDNAYLIKGVYSCEKLSLLTEAGDPRHVCFKRPYDEATLSFNPEYKVLPDMILIQTNEINNWRCFSQPIAESLIDLMSDINGFDEHFGIDERGDNYPCPTQQNTPCMIKMKNDAEVLCTGSSGSYVTHETYCNDKGEMLFIPKHLSRAFCQKKKNAPSCILEKDVDRNINMGSITFASGMAKPPILDLALCDLNLGLPKFEYLFIVNQDEILINQVKQRKYAFVEGSSYSTHATATDNQYLKKAIEKLSGRSISDFTDTGAILVSRNRRQTNGYQMKMWSDNDNFKALVLRYNNSIAAFSWKKKIYAKNPDTRAFHEVNSDKSTNKILSDIILHNRITYGDRINDFDLSRFEDDNNLKSVRIIIKN